MLKGLRSIDNSGFIILYVNIGVLTVIQLEKNSCKVSYCYELFMSFPCHSEPVLFCAILKNYVPRYHILLD